MERRSGQPDILPAGNNPESLVKSPEGRRLLKKTIIENMSIVWKEICKLPEPKVEQLGNDILTADHTRRELIEIHKTSQEVTVYLRNRQPTLPNL